MLWEKNSNSIEIQEMSILSASCSFFSFKRCIIPGKQFLKKFHFIWKLFPAFLFSFFLWKLMIFFRQILLFLVRNYRNWSSLRCITLNAGVYSLTQVFTSTGKGKTLPISLTYPKDELKTSSEEWSMSLHTTNDNFVILKHKRLKGNCEKSDTGHIHLPYGHT